MTKLKAYSSISHLRIFYEFICKLKQKCQIFSLLVLLHFIKFIKTYTGAL